MAAASHSPLITGVKVRAYTVPTDAPESDGTLAWDATTLVLVQIDAGGKQGLGYTYADGSTAVLMRDKLAPLIAGRDAMAINARWQDMVAAIRNLGRPGIASMAIAAVDTALWDLKAKLLELPLAALLGRARRRHSGIRQRRLHQLYDRAPAPAIGRLGQRRHALRKNENRARTGARPGTGGRSAHRNWRGHAIVRRRQRRLYAQAGIGVRARLRGNAA